MSFSVVYGARGGTWTLTSKRQILSLVRLPIPPPSQVFLFYIIMVPLIGVEPITYWLQVSCSTRWAKAAYMVVREGFEPSKAEPSDLQSDPFGRSGTSPLVPRRGIEPLFIEWKSIVLTTERTGQNFLAGVAGFEPTHDGVKVRCLTAWRHPIMVGIARFELAAPCSQGRCATGLRYIPTYLVLHQRLLLTKIIVP